MPRLYAALVAVLLCGSLDSSAASNWTKLRSPNFTLVGDASEGQIRAVARKLEQFREVLIRTLPKAVTTSPVPTVVVVFATQRSMAPFRPLFEGKPVEVAGLFVGSDDINYIMVHAEGGVGNFTSTLHEYAHSVMSDSVGDLPTWANEGLAGVYESFEEREGGKAALIGLAQAQDTQQLRERTPIPIRELLAVERGSAIYNADLRRGLFYAQSWALVHYLSFGSPARTSQFTNYLTRVGAGTPSLQAAEAAFGNLDALQAELRDYSRRVAFPAYLFRFSQKVDGAVTARGQPLELAEADGYLGDLLGRIDRVDDGRAHLRRTLAADPDAARATSALGILELRTSHADVALPLLERAVTLQPDEASFARALGKALIAAMDDTPAGSSERDAAVARARQVLTRAVQLDPSVANAAAMLGYVELHVGEDVARAVTLLQKAAAQAPMREDYQLLLAQALMRQRNYEAATRLLGQLMAGASRPDLREEARRVMGDLAALRRAAIADAAPPAGEPPADPAQPAVSTTAPPAPASRASVPAFRLDLRPVGANETRVLGVFQAIDCAQGSVVLRVQVDARVLRLRTRQIADVDFISYRTDAPKSVTCGPLPAPTRVLATYVAVAATPGSDGEIVAIELLPDGYTPP